MARPLRGLKVLDLGNFLAGPVVSMHLGAMGADVIKLERITGDDSRAIGPMAADGESDFWSAERKTLRPAVSTDRSPRAPGHVLSAADVPADTRERFQERDYEKADMADRRQRFQERLKADPTGGA